VNKEQTVALSLDEIEDAVLRQMYAIMHDETQFPDIRISAAHTILQTVKKRRSRLRECRPSARLHRRTE
jgi:hypothetical protein